MQQSRRTQVLVIGGGPAGLAAALAAHRAGASTQLIEREERPGGILKQCIHDGFGLVRFEEKLSGPEYAERFLEEFQAEQIPLMKQTFVTELVRTGDGFRATVVSKDGVNVVDTDSLILATGCRERTARQVMIHGTRPAGVFTAGTAQYFINRMGEQPARRCVILGSGDIGLIMARRLTLEGATVLGVYEVMPHPSGLTRNLHQCLNDYHIPLFLSHTVTRVFGEDRLTGVEIAQVDEQLHPIAGTEQILDCDTLILSVGLIPENELAEQLGVLLDPRTRGPVCDTDLMTNVPGVFSCGNALHVNDLVDYVSESGEIAGRAAAAYALQHRSPRRDSIRVEIGENVSYLVPQRIPAGSEPSETVFYFRSRSILDRCEFCLLRNGELVYRKNYPFLRPPEMERLVLDLSTLGLCPGDSLTAEIRTK